MNIEDTPNYGELKRLSDAIAAETDSVKKNELIKERNKLLDPRMGMLKCGITRGNNNIIGLIAAKMPTRGDFDFNNLYNSIPQEDFNNAHGHIGSWASPVTGGVDVCFDFLKEEDFISPTSDKHKCKITDKGLLLKENGDYEKYVDFIISEKYQVEQRTKELHQLAHRQAALAEQQVVINRWIMVGTISAGSYAMFSILTYFLDKKQCSLSIEGLTAIFLLLAGVLIGIIISILLLELKQRR